MCQICTTNEYFMEHMHILQHLLQKKFQDSVITKNIDKATLKTRESPLCYQKQ